MHTTLVWFCNVLPFQVYLCWLWQSIAVDRSQIKGSVRKPIRMNDDISIHHAGLLHLIMRVNLFPFDALTSANAPGLADNHSFTHTRLVRKCEWKRIVKRRWIVLDSKQGNLSEFRTKLNQHNNIVVYSNWATGSAAAGTVATGFPVFLLRLVQTWLLELLRGDQLRRTISAVVTMFTRSCLNCG